MGQLHFHRRHVGIKVRTLQSQTATDLAALEKSILDEAFSGGFV